MSKELQCAAEIGPSLVGPLKTLPALPLVKFSVKPSFAMNTTYLSRISAAYLPRLVGRGGGGECGTATYWWQPHPKVYRRSGLENYMAVVASTPTEQTCSSLSWP